MWGNVVGEEVDNNKSLEKMYCILKAVIDNEKILSLGQNLNSIDYKEKNGNRKKDVKFGNCFALNK